MKQLQDADPMPWGKYGPPPKGNGSTMQQVPVEYLNFLWHSWLPVADYIKRNMTALKKEDPDLMWD